MGKHGATLLSIYLPWKTIYVQRVGVNRYYAPNLGSGPPPSVRRQTALKAQMIGRLEQVFDVESF
jgi:hypothetical protein